MVARQSFSDRSIREMKGVSAFSDGQGRCGIRPEAPKESRSCLESYKRTQGAESKAEVLAAANLDSRVALSRYQGKLCRGLLSCCERQITCNLLQDLLFAEVLQLTDPQCFSGTA